MPELFLLGPQIPFRELRRRHFERQRLRHGEAITFEADELPRVVRQQPHRADADVAQDLGADAVVPLVRLEAEVLVRLHRIESLILQCIGADLVRETDAPSLLIQVEQHAPPFGGYPAHREVQLVSAVAA